MGVTHRSNSSLDLCKPLITANIITVANVVLTGMEPATGQPDWPLCTRNRRADGRPAGSNAFPPGGDTADGHGAEVSPPLPRANKAQ